MAKMYQDDVTGETYNSDENIHEYGIVWQGQPEPVIDVHTETVLNDPDAVADKLHEMVDEWREDIQAHIESDDEGVEECHHCDYRWQYTGDKDNATCPSCGNKTPVKRLQLRAEQD